MNLLDSNNASLLKFKTGKLFFKRSIINKPHQHLIFATVIYNTLVALFLFFLLDNNGFLQLFFISNCIGLSILVTNLIFAQITDYKSIERIMLNSLIGLAVGLLIIWLFYEWLFSVNISVANIIYSGLFFAIVASLMAWLYINYYLSNEAIDLIKQKFSTKPIQWVKASIANDIFIINTKDIHYFQAQQKYVSVYTKDKEYLINTPIKKLKQQLDANHFWQIHRATIINLNFVDKINKNSQDRLVIKMVNNPKELIVSRSFIHQFKKM